MAFTPKTKMANRYGLNIKFYNYVSDGELEDDAEPIVTIDFANEVSIEVTSELTWATGGQAHANMISFKDPTEGTITISTQVTTLEVLALAAGLDPTEVTDTVSFMNDAQSSIPKSYIVKGETVWQGEDGTTYNEEITAYKAYVKPAHSAVYNGSGDPQNMDIEFELGTNDSGMLLDVKRTDIPAPTP